jgi:hypothetical protein
MRVVHLKRERFDARIDRTTVWGNPYYISDERTREDVIKLYVRHLLAHPELIERARTELRGKVLGCWCKPEACHGDVLVIVANARSYREAIQVLEKMLEES